MPNRTYVQMYVETGRWAYIVKNRSYILHNLSDAYRYLNNHPEKVEEVVKERVRVGKFAHSFDLHFAQTSFQWLFLELQIINSWIQDEQFSGDTMCVVPVDREPSVKETNPYYYYIPKHIQHRKKGRR